ncbi:hypothetical protein [Mycobacterium lacus]|nr:hypothetical protein [Mycobacterium lacus]
MSMAEKLTALSRDFGSQRRLAELLLVRLYTTEAAERWLVGTNPSLGN